MVECTGLENRRAARYRGFESLPDRWTVVQRLSTDDRGVVPRQSGGFLILLSIADAAVMRCLRRILRRFSEVVVGHLQVVLFGYRLAVADPGADYVDREYFRQLRLSGAA